MSSTKSRVLVLVQSCQVESWGLGALPWCLFSMPVLYSVLRALCYSLELTLGSPLMRGLLRWTRREILGMSEIHVPRWVA